MSRTAHKGWQYADMVHSFGRPWQRRVRPEDGQFFVLPKHLRQRKERRAGKAEAKEACD